MEKKGLAIVTGASSGIGAAVARGLARDGYRVVLIARNREKLGQVDREIRERDRADQEPIPLPLDILDHESLDRGIKDVNARYGRVDILVNAAAMYMKGSLTESVETYREIVNTNQIAQYALFKTVVEIMKGQKSGYIFNIASRSGKYGFPNGGIYGSTKFALVGLADALYRELSPLGIRVTSLCPGWVNTDMAFKGGAAFSGEEMIQPSDLLASIRYLLSLSPHVCIKEIVIEFDKSIV